MDRAVLQLMGLALAHPEQSPLHHLEGVRLMTRLSVQAVEHWRKSMRKRLLTGSALALLILSTLYSSGTAATLVRDYEETASSFTLKVELTDINRTEQLLVPLGTIWAPTDATGLLLDITHGGRFFGGPRRDQIQVHINVTHRRSLLLPASNKAAHVHDFIDANSLPLGLTTTTPSMFRIAHFGESILSRLFGESIFGGLRASDRFLAITPQGIDSIIYTTTVDVAERGGDIPRRINRLSLTLSGRHLSVSRGRINSNVALFQLPLSVSRERISSDVALSQLPSEEEEEEEETIGPNRSFFHSDPALSTEATDDD
jgi:hypothetical protein